MAPSCPCRRRGAAASSMHVYSGKTVPGPVRPVLRRVVLHQRPFRFDAAAAFLTRAGAAKRIDGSGVIAGDGGLRPQQDLLELEVDRNGRYDFRGLTAVNRWRVH